MGNVKIAIIGEIYEIFKPHSTLNQSLKWLQEDYDFSFEWIDTEKVNAEGYKLLSEYSGIWSAPGSPFKSLDGAVKAIQIARENIFHILGLAQDSSTRSLN